MVELLFSVIVPVYNAARTLSHCIASVLHQTYDDFELILVNDGSVDASLQICNDYAETDSRVIIIHQVNQGHTAARQAGLGLSHGEYILFLDSDDWFEPGLLMACKKAIDRTSCDLVLFGHNAMYETEGKHVANPTYKANKFYGTIKESPLFPQLIMDERGRSIPRALWGKAFARALVQKWLPLVPKQILTGEDMCCFLACAKEARGVVLLKSIYYNYRIKGGTLSRKSDPKAIARCRYTLTFLDQYITDGDIEFQPPVNRLIIQQMYSALQREVSSGKLLKDVSRDLEELIVSPVSVKALDNFSCTSFELWMKHFIVKNRLVGIAKLLWFVRKREFLR